MSTQIAPAVIAGSVSLVVAGVGWLVNYASSKRERRRKLYAEAVRAALSWQEMLYRVRRRAPVPEATIALVGRFHDLQESIFYHQAWISAESKSMGKSYNRLVREVKEATEQLIIDAWNEPVRTPPGNAKPGDTHPDVDPFAEKFLADVRSHLSAQPWRWIALWKRSKDY